MHLRILKSEALTSKSHNTPIVMTTGERDVSHAVDIMGRTPTMMAISRLSINLFKTLFNS